MSISDDRPPPLFSYTILRADLNDAAALNMIDKIVKFVNARGCVELFSSSDVLWGDEAAAARRCGCVANTTVQCLNDADKPDCLAQSSNDLPPAALSKTVEIKEELIDENEQTDLFEQQAKATATITIKPNAFLNELLVSVNEGQLNGEIPQDSPCPTASTSLDCEESYAEGEEEWDETAPAAPATHNSTASPTSLAISQNYKDVDMLQLQRRVRILERHSDIKSLRCKFPSCGKVICVRPGKLSSHVLTHLKTPMHGCALCPYTTTGHRKDVLTHFSKVHRNRNMHKKDAVTSLRTPEAYRRQLELALECFDPDGDVKADDFVVYDCQLCDSSGVKASTGRGLSNLRSLRSHVTLHIHNSDHFYQCSACSYHHQLSSAVSRHIKELHPETDAYCLDTKTEETVRLVDEVFKRCFPTYVHTGEGDKLSPVPPTVAGAGQQKRKRGEGAPKENMARLLVRAQQGGSGLRPILPRPINTIPCIECRASCPTSWEEMLSHVLSHMSTYIPTTRYSCSICGEAARYSSYLVSHVCVAHRDLSGGDRILALAFQVDQWGEQLRSLMLTRARSMFTDVPQPLIEYLGLANDKEEQRVAARVTRAVKEEMEEGEPAAKRPAASGCNDPPSRRMHQCMMCGTMLRFNSDDMMRHVRSHMERELPEYRYACTLCGKLERASSTLLNHVVAIHPEKCGKSRNLARQFEKDEWTDEIRLGAVSLARNCFSTLPRPLLAYLGAPDHP